MSAAGCIVYCKGLVLLARRIEGENVPYSGYWSIFAGSREPPSEPPTICAIRELEEETGIKIKTNDLILARSLYSKGKIFDIFYTEFDDFPIVNLNFEHTEYGWFDISNLKSFPYLIDDKIVDIVMSNEP
tara:strand:- start:610 stop:999 length:390 start_codon:yes stop_codon:yes gene_type:complete